MTSYPTLSPSVLEHLCESMEVDIACHLSHQQTVRVNGHVLDLIEVPHPQGPDVRTGQWSVDGQPVERAGIATALGIAA